MPEIKTLVTDIYRLLEKKQDGWFTDELARSLSDDLARRLRSSLGENSQRATLRLSQMGPRCPCALWYSIHHPELAEPVPPWTEIKFSFGHILEALVICLAKAAGHEVTGEQDELELDGIVGHRDCVIDGCTVDVKSASSLSFIKFKSPQFEKLDSFGYLDQLDGYVIAASDDPLVRVKNKGYLLAVDKTLGHLYLKEHRVTLERKIILSERIRRYKAIVEGSTAPHCECGTIPEGASGNIRLDTKASYSPFKYCCHPSLRAFRYSSGPVYLTKVVRTPDVPEIRRPSSFMNSKKKEEEHGTDGAEYSGLSAGGPGEHSLRGSP